jgi:hypothetical protein
MLRDFGPYGIIFMNVCVVITVAMVNNAVEEFWALWDSTYDYMCVYYFRISRHSWRAIY